MAPPNSIQTPPVGPADDGQQAGVPGTVPKPPPADADGGREFPTRPGDWLPASQAREWKYIVLHHTAVNSGDVDSIHQAHLKNKDKSGKPWLGIGYHFVVGNGQGMNDGEVEPTFRWKQQLPGAHAGVADYNQRGIGVVLVGNFEERPPTTMQLKAVKQLIGLLTKEYSIPASGIIGHGDVKATECPGKMFPMQEVRESVAARDAVTPSMRLVIHRPTPTGNSPPTE